MRDQFWYITRIMKHHKALKRIENKDFNLKNNFLSPSIVLEDFFNNIMRMVVYVPLLNITIGQPLSFSFYLAEKSLIIKKLCK